jgi:hypothetical protein
MAAWAKIVFTKLFAFAILQRIVIKRAAPMRLNRNQCRAVYAALIILAFFIPAYDQTSALHFLFLSVGTVGTDSEITLLDLGVILLPLLLVPFTAIVVLVKAVKKRPLNSLLLSLPFFSLAFFFLILSFDVSRQVNSTTVFSFVTQMRVGFYLAAFASLLLLLSYSRRESLNLNSGGH